jgi:hypothetical protein
MATLRFTDDDRDENGFVKVPAPAEPRSLADLLPTPQSIQADARAKPKARHLMIVGPLAVLAIVLAVWSDSSGDRPAIAPPRPAPAAQPTGEATVTPSPIPAAIPAAAGRLLIAFAAPDGQPLGAIESTRAITPTAHYGDGWIQADVEGSGLVWLRASDAPELAIVGPDLAPRPTATARPYVRPTDPPQPPCLTAGTGTQVVTVCDWLEADQLSAAAAAKWVATYGGNLGTVDHPTPYGGTP